jgi:hypothetical protein
METKSSLKYLASGQGTAAFTIRWIIIVNGKTSMKQNHVQTQEKNDLVEYSRLTD